jgi:4-amino-4-deoxy-L-arabinose transferase-like glycosyltransferase
MNGRGPFDALLRPGATGRGDVIRDLLWLVAIALLTIATGIGLRDPWPADEPRFALIARDMVATGEWLIPRVGGDIYADKPPLYFWLMATAIELTGSLRIAFLLPSFLAATGTVLLTYDLGRRLWNREVGLTAGLALLFAVQFVWQARQAQIDATLCFWTTLSLYGLLRHVLHGPRWGWYCIGWAAAGLGVITKGVGFLPLLVLIPFALLRAPRWSPRFTVAFTPKWLLGPVSFALAIAVWLVPVLIVARGDATLAAYRDEILFTQTIHRYADAWHHREPFWYFLAEVIPGLWLPLTALLPWLVPQWRKAWQARDLRIALLTLWIVFVVAFFSASTGKRGVYVLPAVPALALACAPYLRAIGERVAAQRCVFIVTAVVVVVVAAAIPYALVNPDVRNELIATYELDPLAPLILIALGTLIVCITARPTRGFAAFAGSMCVVALVVSFWVNPVMNDVRSGRRFIERVTSVADPDAPLGFVGFKEQYLLQIRRPIVHFGHARWREREQETNDAAHWLAQSPEHQLVVDEAARLQCFQNAQHRSLGIANRVEWSLVRGAADPQCVEQGVPEVAHTYTPYNTLRSPTAQSMKHDLSKRPVHEH